MRIGDIEIRWLGHAGFLIRNSKVIYIDPYNIKGNSEKTRQFRELFSSGLQQKR